VANPNFDEVATATLDKRMKEACDNIGKSTFMLNKLEKTAKTLTGFDGIVENIKYKRNESGKWYQGYETLPLEQQKMFTAIRNPWSQYVMNISFCGAELKQNRGEAAVLNLMAERIADAESAHREDWNKFLIHGDGSDPRAMHGLPLLLGTGPYGGIDPNLKGCEWWKPWVCDPRQDFLDAGGAPADFKEPPLTWKKFMEMAICIDNGRSRPDCIMLAKDLYMGLISSLESQLNHQNPTMVSFGIEHVTYMGMDFGFDFEIPDGTWYALNTEYLTWWRQSDCFMTSTGFKEPVDQDAKIAHILSMTQLTTCKRMAHGVGYCFKPAC